MFSIIFCLLAVVGSLLVQAASPPDDVVIITPSSTTPYAINSTVKIGVASPQIEGLFLSVNTSIVLPNNTKTPFIGIFSSNCKSFNGTATGDFNQTQQPGLYTIFWNVTYGYPSNPTPDSCGNGTFSFQNWMLNETFTVSNSSGGAVGVITSTATLPSAPTGTVISVSTGGAIPVVASVQTAGLVGTLLAATLLLLFV